MKYSEEGNPYIDLVTYSDIYHELVFERNEAIRWLYDHAMLDRDKFVKKTDKKQGDKHKNAYAYRLSFQHTVLLKLDRLYSHDAIEAMYDFNNIDLGNWSDTEANRLEKQLNQLQLIITKLEIRYALQYKTTIEYRPSEQTLYLNSIEIFSCGTGTIRHRLLTAFYSKPSKLWQNEDLERYFIKHFNYQEGDLTDKQVEKNSNDITKDVAAKIGAKDFLIVSNSTVRINPKYLP